MIMRVRTVLGEGLRASVMLSALVLAVVVILQQVHTVRVFSNSMEPTIAAGDIALVRAVPAEELEVGMVVLASNPDGATFMHRIIAVDHDAQGSLILHTQGDSNPLPDSWTSRVSTPRISVMFARVPLGWIGQHLPAH